MMLTGPQAKDGNAGQRALRSGAVALFAVLGLGLASAGALAQDKGPQRPERPPRVLTIQGQVSLPEGMPAGQVIVTLTSSSGVPRQAYSTEQGRFEFQGIPEGGYSLTARSLSDPQLVTGVVDTDSTRTATGTLNVNLTLRKDVAAAAPKKAEVVSVAEAEQKVPKPARKAFREAVKYRAANQPEKALESLNRAVELYPDYFQALAARGDLLLLQRRLTEAGADFERALRANPHYGPALRGAGYCKLERSEFNEAAKYLEQSIKAQPDQANAYLLLGIAYLELDRRAESRAALIKALGFNTPRELRAHIYLGNLYARERLYAEAADELRKYLEAVPADPEAEELRAVELKWRARAARP